MDNTAVGREMDNNAVVREMEDGQHCSRQGR